ncbi:MAG: hypothetical protein AB1846_03515 [Chloroflexota bacterium]
MKGPAHLAFWRSILALTALSLGGFGLAARGLMLSLGVPATHPKGLALLAGLAVALLATLALLALTWTPASERLLRALTFAGRLEGKAWRVAGWIAFVLILPLFTLLIMHPYTGSLIRSNLGLRWGFFWGASLLLLYAFKTANKNVEWELALVIVVIVHAIFYRLAFFIPQVNNDPFVPGWSESSRFYDASLFFAQRIYGEQVPLSVLHPSLHLLYAAPFAIPGTPIILHRLWQTGLFLGLTVAVGALFVRRLKIEGRGLRWLVLGWAFLFILQGPIYTHLLVPVLLVFWGYDNDNPRRTMEFVLLASVWAGLSRINWFPVPGMLAAALYLLETPRRFYRKTVLYLSMPFNFFAFGTLAAFASQRLYILFSGNGETAQFYSSLSSPLLWERLLPNGTFWLGVLPGALILSLPLWGILFYSLRKVHLHPLRLAGILAALAALFLGGIVVSLKIGGGGDLHNLDAYIVMLMLVGGYAVFGRIAPDQKIQSQETLESGDAGVQNLLILRRLPWVLLSALIPAWFALQQVGGPVGSVDPAAAQTTLAEVRQRVESAAANGDPVLFISQRHLLAFGEVDVPLVTDYEKDFLIEMVMSGNVEYLGQFYDDLYHRRFGLIVVEPQVYAFAGPDDHFGPENNAWVRKITRPILCDYEPVATYPEYNLQLLAPRAGPQECPK